MRIAKIPSMAYFILKNKLNTKPIAPRNNNDTYGKFFVGCNLANTLKKAPSRAAANGTRLYPSVVANKEANATKSITPVARPAAWAPDIFFINSLTTYLFFIASCQGITLVTLRFINKYKTVMPATDISILRGIFFPGFFISPPRWQTL